LLPLCGDVDYRVDGGMYLALWLIFKIKNTSSYFMLYNSWKGMNN